MGKRRVLSVEDEYVHQRAIFNFTEIMSIRHPEFKMIVGSLNGIWLEGKNKWAIIKKLQKAGCFPVGYPDIHWPMHRKPYSGLYIELKRDLKSKMSAEQKEWKKWLTEQRFLATVSYSENETKDILMRYFEGGMRSPAPEREGPLADTYL